MSDFLSNLAAQAFGEHPTLHPRLPARFEPRVAARDEAADEGGSPLAPARRPAELSPAVQHRAAPTPTNEPSSVRPTRARAVPRAIDNSVARPMPRAEGQHGEPMSSPLFRSNREPGTAPQSGSTVRRPAPVAHSSPSPRNPIPRPPEGRERGERAPTIHVSIGRVEIRAIHPTPAGAAPKRVPEPPRESLGAYLRGRRDVA